MTKTVEKTNQSTNSIRDTNGGESLKAENARLREALREAREAFFIIARHPIKYDPQAYAVVRGIAEIAIDDADAALSPQETTK